MHKIKLYGFNNLSKSLSFCIYDICYAPTNQDCYNYVSYINKKYNSCFLIEILTQVCVIIQANIISISHQDYEPQGASATILISENKINHNNNLIIDTKNNQHISTSFLTHLDKSHICMHTYPESNTNNRICTFRVDIEISTCGLISPLKAINYLINKLDSNILTIDYKIRGFTRDINGKKHFIDHKITSIQDFISENIKTKYSMIDVNLYQENIFHTKMRIKNNDLNKYLFNTKLENFNINENKKITNILSKEIQEIYLGCNF